MSGSRARRGSRSRSGALSGCARIRPSSAGSRGSSGSSIRCSRRSRRSRRRPSGSVPFVVEMSLVSLVGVDKSYGTWPVLQGVDLVVPDGARIGIIGPNGAGKSTILRILGSTEEINGGDVARRGGLTVRYHDQNPEGDGRTAEAWVVAARPDIAALDEELRGIEQELARPDVAGDLAKMDRVLTRQQEVLDRWVDAGGAGLAGEAKAMLLRLGFDE